MRRGELLQSVTNIWQLLAAAAPVNVKNTFIQETIFSSSIANDILNSKLQAIELASVLLPPFTLQ